MIIKKVIIYIIKFYRILSRYTPRVCRFYPTCSQYTIEAIEKHGLKKGIPRGIKRILKCHPFNPGGYDPL